MIRTIYQTLEDRNNPDEIESDGPFPCSKTNAWLGRGYYFWESFEDNAHWWGKKNYKNGYVICRAYYDLDETLCINLVDNPTHISDFSKTLKDLRNRKIINEKTAVCSVLEFIRKRNNYKYEASRVYGVNSKSLTSEYSHFLRFNVDKPQYLNLAPEIQICFYKKNCLGFRDYAIIYPQEYIEGCAV